MHHEVSVLQNLSRRGLSVFWEHESRCLEFCWLFVPSPLGPADLLLQVACCGVPAARVLRFWWMNGMMESSAVSSELCQAVDGHVSPPSNAVYRRAF